MSGEDSSTYAPKSPDLSSFYSAGPPSQPPSQFSQLPPSNFSQSPYGAGNTLHAPSPYGYQTQASYAPIKPEYNSYAPPTQQQYVSNTVNQEASHSYESHNAPIAPGPYGLPYLDQSPYPAAPNSELFQQNSAPKVSVPEAGNQDYSEMPTRRSAAAATAPPPTIDPSPVRTKFPTARIKRIMQADEEVGKVAQQTPIAVGKALELFMVQMVSKSADVAKEKGSRRVTAAMLKQVVETDEQWDFLRDIVSRVEHEKEGGRAKAKTESESDEEAAEPKKKGRGRKKKA